MKLINFTKKPTTTISLTIVLLTGFIFIAYTYSAHAFSIDFSGLPGFGGNQGLDLLKGPKGDTGPQGPPGKDGATVPRGEQWPLGSQGVKGDKGDMVVTGQGVEFGHLKVIVHTNDFISPENPLILPYI